MILGNGPSLSHVPIHALAGDRRIDTMSINHPDPRAWPTTYWAFCDLSQYNRHKQHWNEYQGKIITSSSLQHDRPNAVKIRSLGGPGFSHDLLNGFYIGRSTVYANMQTALWMDYDKIFILGCDMAASPDGQTWFYGVNEDVKPENRVSRFEAEAAFYEKASQTLPPDIRNRFYFCSSWNPWSFVTRFNHLRHEDAMPVILGAA